MKEFLNTLRLIIVLFIFTYILLPLIPKNEKGIVLVKKILEAGEKMR